MKYKKVVCFGGGNAIPKVLLSTLRKYPMEITSITSMTDDGGSTGELRRDLGVLPTGDIRRHMLAFSDAPEWKKKLWGMRFGSEEFEGGHKGHSFGNLFIAGIEKNTKSYEEVLKACNDFLEIDKKYKALPATVSKVTLCAELMDGKVIESESEIDVPKKHDPRIAIKKIFLKPSARAYAPALSEIEKADALIFGPGDLYSSTLACFLPIGMKSAIGKSKATKILVCNIMNKLGETDDFSVEDFANEVEKYMGTKLDYVLYNNNETDKVAMKVAKGEDKSLMGPVGYSKELDKNKFLGATLVMNKTIMHDAKKTCDIIWKLISK